MITVFRNGELHYKNKVYRCALGKNGIIKEKKEGDGFTPSGIFSLGSLYYRPDRIKKINSFFKPIPIKSNMFWSDYPDSKYYNNCNNCLILKNKGSAIFIHLAKKNFSPTAGCIALKKNCLLDILKYLKTTDKIKIVL